MTDSTDKRQGPDRRRHPRGGRRTTDVAGFTPLVFVVDARPTGREAVEAILAKLRFAVAPFDSVERAKHALAGLRPDIILTADSSMEDIRAALAEDPDARRVPIVALRDGEMAPEALIERVRQALRHE
jgi:hypothetical protein